VPMGTRSADRDVQAAAGLGRPHHPGAELVEQRRGLGRTGGGARVTSATPARCRAFGAESMLTVSTVSAKVTM
jgi:hypothetical protein